MARAYCTVNDVKKYLMRKVWFSYNRNVDMKVAKLKNYIDAQKIRNEMY